MSLSKKTAQKSPYPGSETVMFTVPLFSTLSTWPPSENETWDSGSDFRRNLAGVGSDRVQVNVAGVFVTILSDKDIDSSARAAEYQQAVLERVSI